MEKFVGLRMGSSVRPSSRLAIVAALALLFWSGVASACPNCAGDDTGGVAYLLLMASMIIAPFGIAFVCWPIIQELGEGEPIDGEELR